MTKQEVRQEARRRLRLLTADERAALSCKICRALSEHPWVRGAQVVMAYHPLADEPDVRPFLRQLQAEGKEVWLPRVDGDALQVVRYADEAALSYGGAFGIGEPVGTDIGNLSPLGVIVVPGLAFTAAGARMGRGKGFYDRFLAQRVPPEVRRLGVCFPCSLFAELPTDAADVPMHDVLTIK